MKAEHVKSQLIVMGEPRALIEDYLDSTQAPSINGYWQYKSDEESSNAAQVRWDARCRNNPVMGSSSITGDGIAGLMSNLRK